MENIVDHLDRVGIRHAQTVDELRLNSQFPEAGADRLSAAVDYHHFHSDGLQKHDIAHGLTRQLRIFHRAAAEFHHGNGVFEFLNERKRLVEHIRLSDKFLHFLLLPKSYQVW